MRGRTTQPLTIAFNPCLHYGSMRCLPLGGDRVSCRVQLVSPSSAAAVHVPCPLGNRQSAASQGYPAAHVFRPTSPFFLTRQRLAGLGSECLGKFRNAPLHRPPYQANCIS
jgi:hypothetical protein